MTATRLWRRHWRAACALLVAGALLAVRVPVSSGRAADFPRHAPDALAHFLADFSNHQRLDQTIGTWWVEREAGNFTWWEYVVGYECGARCGGRAELRTRAQHRSPAPQHGSAAPSSHHLLLRDTRCRTLPVLGWPYTCEEIETETVVSGREGGGARLTEEARGRCALVAVLSARCDLSAARTQHAHALRAALH